MCDHVCCSVFVSVLASLIGRIFPFIGTLNKHVRAVHDKQRQHRCDFCEATFAEAGNRNKHVQRMHSGKMASNNRSAGAARPTPPTMQAVHNMRASRGADDSLRLVGEAVGASVRADANKGAMPPALPFWSPQGH